MSQNNVHSVGSILRHRPCSPLHCAEQLEDGDPGLKLDVDGELPLPAKKINKIFNIKIQN